MKVGQAERFVADLADAVGGDVFTDILHRVAYSTDASIYQIIPACVVAPRDSADVVAVVKYAAVNGVPVAARGAASGVAGESLCGGIVFDMTRHMNRIISVSDDGGIAVCEPGVVLDDLNSCLAGYGRKIGPDPSSSNRATIGGCVANNATGAHSLAYGYIADYVEAIEAVLADGSVVRFENDFDPAGATDDRLGSIAKSCFSIVSGSQAVISKALPKTRRNRSGYNVADVCHNDRVDLARLLAGSEGTLAIFTKITVRTVPLPSATALLQLEFDSFEKMAEAVPIIVAGGASACELMDKKLIDMAIDSLPRYRDIFPAGAAAVLLVEQAGQTQQEARERIENTDLQVGALASGRKIISDSQTQKRVWKSRKDAVPLLDRRKGRKHPVPFIEDVSVDNTHLAKYISSMAEIGRRYEIEMSFYGHAGDGELHIRPYLDLGEPSEVEKMRSIANEVFSIAWSLGGSISGEHADGLVRAAFLRHQYGDEFYNLLGKIKNIFDPSGMMNPGKIINSDADIMVKNLRAAHRFIPEGLKAEMLFEDDELGLQLEQCNGCGVCLSREAELRMCPVFRAVGDELSSSRAKANILRFWATGRLEKRDFESSEFRKFLDLCINCKACSLECPSGVDISKLITVARIEYIKHAGLRGAELVLARNRYLSMLGSVFSPVSGLVMNLPTFKWFLEKFAGIESRRSMPDFKRGSFLKVGRKFLASCKPIEKPINKVAYFVDSYANYNDHELGFAVLEVLRHNDIEVVLPRQLPVPLPAICYGDIATARRDLTFIVEHLIKAVRDGYKVVCSEPSAALCLKTELRHFVSGKDAQLISENSYELMGYLLELFKRNKLRAAEGSVSGEFAYHLPCHQLAIGGAGATVELLEKLCKIDIEELNAGCCGLAGTYGMQKKNYDLSSKIAEPLRAVLESSSAEYVLTECAACKMQIQHISSVAVTHPIKILAEAYGLS